MGEGWFREIWLTTIFLDFPSDGRVQSSPLLSADAPTCTWRSFSRMRMLELRTVNFNCDLQVLQPLFLLPNWSSFTHTPFSGLQMCCFVPWQSLNGGLTRVSTYEPSMCMKHDLRSTLWVRSLNSSGTSLKSRQLAVNLEDGCLRFSHTRRFSWTFLGFFQLEWKMKRQKRKAKFKLDSIWKMDFLHGETIECQSGPMLRKKPREEINTH